MTPQEFKLFVKLYRKQHTKAWRLKNQNPRLPRMLYPHAIEEVYAGEISKVQQRLVDYAIGRLQAILPKLYRKDDLRSDAETDELEALLKELEAELAEYKKSEPGPGETKRLKVGQTEGSESPQEAFDMSFKDL